MSDSQFRLPLLFDSRPMVMVTGFLGAGKTTFLRALLESLQGWHLAADVILNDYENADLDAATLEDRAANVESLSASCACCSGLEPLVDLAMASSRSRNDVLLIELNGTADPLPLLESFTVLESRLHLRPRWQICMVDARHFGNRWGYLDDLEGLQLETASHYMITHASGLGKIDKRRLEDRIKAANPQASPATADSLAEDLARVIARGRRLSIPQTQWKKSPGHGIPFVGRRIAHEFTGCQILLPERVSRQAMWDWLAALPSDVLRAKALVAVTGEKKARRLFARVGTELMPDPLEVPIGAAVPSAAICIGPDLDPGVLLNLAVKYLGPECSLETPQHV
jgi:G3E family GTPase